MIIFLFKAHRDTLYSALYKYLFIIDSSSKQIWIERAIFNDSEAKYTKRLLLCKKEKTKKKNRLYGIMATSITIYPQCLNDNIRVNKVLSFMILKMLTATNLTSSVLILILFT